MKHEGIPFGYMVLFVGLVLVGWLFGQTRWESPSERPSGAITFPESISVKGDLTGSH
jgi:hypothetical protein